MTLEALRGAIEALSSERDPDEPTAREVVSALLDALERGAVRAAEPAEGRWRVTTWVKLGILLGFRVARDVETDIGTVFRFRDRDLFGPRGPGAGRARIVPGGTTVRRGAHLAEDVVIMPPAYVNVGAFVGARTLVDSHALVGSCAQIGAGVHLSAGVQIGGVLEPVGAMPVVVEDGAFVGGNCGVYEGTRVGAGAVLAPGTILSRAVPLFDLVAGRVLRAEAGRGLEVPPRAVVVPGARPAPGELARERGLMLQAPMIVKYRDAATDASLALEEALR